MSTIKALIFDFDGTILDTETAWYEAFREIALEHDIELTLDMYGQCIGTSLHVFDPYDYLIMDKQVPMDRETLSKHVHARHTKMMAQEGIRPGILDYLAGAQELGLRIGLASSSKRAWIDNYLAQLGIAHYFETIRTAEDVELVKPHPALYELALQDLGVQPHEAVAIEDSPNGARAAAAAGMHYIVVPNPVTTFLTFDGEPHRLESLAELSLQDMLNRVLTAPDTRANSTKND
ncbi:HAD-IA family hydrolase [Paenibacillus qinlingensis]|uniref:Hydrolase of the HAD superfamily n=1 Tax=Paenibacillus qinlingensis TaxID=1837343 RepID=A0ABU1NY85_9BACL|nr:HAD-IA family hydrolase [Paenibacillus qinlingensis]MDR6552459.1 putative hydrolase of the HAD superfamily [Paenibacillus qinlingensis]